jgi:hypothetical protein
VETLRMASLWWGVRWMRKFEMIVASRLRKRCKRSRKPYFGLWAKYQVPEALVGYPSLLDVIAVHILFMFSESKLS